MFTVLWKILPLVFWCHFGKDWSMLSFPNFVWASTQLIAVETLENKVCKIDNIGCGNEVVQKDPEEAKTRTKAATSACKEKEEVRAIPRGVDGHSRPLVLVLPFLLPKLFYHPLITWIDHECLCHRNWTSSRCITIHLQCDLLISPIVLDYIRLSLCLIESYLYRRHSQ